METRRFSDEMLVLVYQTERRHIPGDLLRGQGHEHFKPQTFGWLS